MQIRNDLQPATFVKYEGQVPDGIAKKNFESAGIDFRIKPFAWCQVCKCMDDASSVQPRRNHDKPCIHTTDHYSTSKISTAQLTVYIIYIYIYICVYIYVNILI